MEFSGRLTAFPVGEILQWLKNERRSGTLVVRSGRREKRVLVRGGAVVGCVSEHPEESYTRYLLINGHLDPQTLVAVLSYAQKRSRLLGEALSELRLLPTAQIRDTLRSHTIDAVCGLFLWGDGYFFFERQDLAEPEVVPAPIDTFSLVMEGNRWLDEYRRICAVFVHDRVILTRGPEWPGGDLTPIQQRVVAGLEPRETLAGLYRQIKGSYFRFLEAVFDLQRRQVLEIGGWTARKSGGEVVADDVLLAGATGEQVLISNRSLMLPIEVVERLYPLWVRFPGPERLGRLSAEALEFFRQINGSRPLGELCSGDVRHRHRLIEILFEEVGRGNLALLPAAVERLEARADEQKEPTARRWWRRLDPSSPV